MPRRARSRSSSRGRSQRASERTPLLRRITERNEDGSVVDDVDVLAAEVAEQGEGGAPQFPDSGKSRRDSHGQLVSADEAVSSTEEYLVRFQENGLIEGVGKGRFRCVFGGILLGYFVRLRLFHGSFQISIAKNGGESDFTNMDVDCHVRFYTYGFKSPSHHILLQCLELSIMVINSLSFNFDITSATLGPPFRYLWTTAFVSCWAGFSDRYYCLVRCCSKYWQLYRSKSILWSRCCWRTFYGQHYDERLGQH